MAFNDKDIFSSNWLLQDFDKLFANFDMDKVFSPEVKGSTFEKNSEGTTITLAVPGNSRSTLEIEVVDNEFFVKTIGKDLPKYATRINRRYKFDPNQYDANNLEAECKDGILTIKLPFKKKEAIKSNKIVIK